MTTALIVIATVISVLVLAGLKVVELEKDLDHFLMVLRVQEVHQEPQDPLGYQEVGVSLIDFLGEMLLGDQMHLLEI